MWTCLWPPRLEGAGSCPLCSPPALGEPRAVLSPRPRAKSRCASKKQSEAFQIFLFLCSVQMSCGIFLTCRTNNGQAHSPRPSADQVPSDLSLLVIHCVRGACQSRCRTAWRQPPGARALSCKEPAISHRKHPQIWAVALSHLPGAFSSDVCKHRARVLVTAVD